MTDFRGMNKKNQIGRLKTANFQYILFRKNFRIGDFENSAILDFFLQKKKKIFFAWSPWKSVTNYVVEWMGLNFDVFPGFQQIPCYA